MAEDWVHGSQFNGIVWFGKIVGTTNEGKCVIRYYYDPAGDPPRQAYRVEDADRVHRGLPDWCDPAKLIGVPE